MWIKGNTSSCEEPAVDGDDYSRGRSASASGLSSSYAGNHGAGGYSGRVYSVGGLGGGGHGLGGHGGDDGDDGNKRNRRVVPGSFATYQSDEDEEDESADEDDYGLPSGLPPAQTQTQFDDDDVPLARSIPTALKAQQSIRIKDREARDKRRKEREIRALARDQQRQHQAAINSSSIPTQEAAPNVARPARITSASQKPTSSFAIDDLTRKLENVQTRGRPDSRPSPPSADAASRFNAVLSKDVATSAPPIRTLRPMRSFHRPGSSQKVSDTPPLPISAEARLTRSTTRGRARSTASREDPSSTIASQARAIPISTPVDEPGTAKVERKRTVKSADGIKSARTSTEHSRPPPPLPAPAEVIARQNHAKITLTQQRVFIGDRQRFVVVEISSSTSAGEVVRMVEAQGAFKEWRGSGGWMLFEIAQDFGMERPIRSFELLSDVEASWNKDKLVNVFLLKLTPLASILSRSALPSSSPTHSGYVEWESKRGKWNKRYLMLKEHSLWLSKRDNGRDEIMLCSLSNFDAYQITRLVRAPKDFTFAVKSTDNLSFFENTADYLHIFSCKTDAGEKWMEKILLARSYILHQERNILFKAPAKAHQKSPPPQTVSTGLSRSLTKRAGATQPLVNVNPGNLFEPGSLLHG
ncbi:hypothetical protein F5877DRAFT_33871 [Lentinula edodes]|nr:hypothetical protein F5877DRAFT_33871 [Lentinula edodes]